MAILREKWRYFHKNRQEIATKSLIVFVMFLLAFGGYGLGKVGYIRGEKSPIRILSSSEIPFKEEANNNVNSSTTQRFNGEAEQKVSQKVLLPGELENVDFEEIKKLKSGGIIIGTKSSKKYYFPWCGTAQRLKESNAVVFKSAQDARDAGFVPAKNCKGLE